MRARQAVINERVTAAPVAAHARRAYSFNMKTVISVTMIAAIATAFSACTSSTTTTQNTSSTRPIYTTEKKVYSKEELDKRGRQTVQEALAAEDPSITTTGR